MSLSLNIRGKCKNNHSPKYWNCWVKWIVKEKLLALIYFNRKLIYLFLRKKLSRKLWNFSHHLSVFFKNLQEEIRNYNLHLRYSLQQLTCQFKIQHPEIEWNIQFCILGKEMHTTFISSLTWIKEYAVTLPWRCSVQRGFWIKKTGLSL